MSISNRFIGVVACTLLCFTTVWGRPLPVAFTQWLQSENMQAATVAVEIRNLTTGEIVYEHEAHRAVIPASVTKLTSTGAALRLLGPDYRVETEVFTTGETDSVGTLHGDIVIVGHGDALLGSSRSQFARDLFLQNVWAALNKAGIRRIEGRVIGDGSAIPAPWVGPGWEWEDFGNYYAPPIAGLNWGDNVFSLIFDTSKKNARPTLIRTEPEIPGMVIENCLTDEDAAHDKSYVYGGPRVSLRTIIGSIPHKNPTYTVRVSVPDPPAFAAQALERYIYLKGIEAYPQPLPKGTGAQSSGERKLLTVYRGESLEYVVNETNTNSNNLFAEMVLHQISLAQADGGREKGVKAVMDYWKGRGLDMRGVKLYDGCGLSPDTRVTAHFMCNLLADMKDDRAFRASLPVAGRTGTLAMFLKGTRLQGKAHLKTGTLKNVVAYSGYIYADKGEIYAVSFIVNDYAGTSTAVRKKVENLLLLMIP